jgi:vacuolar-type H+-ATPase subunit H
MRENPSHSVIIKTVGEIKSAEEKYDRIVARAKEKADSILRKAKEEIADERASVKEEITKYKNEKLKSGRDDIEKDVKKTVEKAKGEAEGISRKKLGKPKILSIGKSFISQL